MGIEDRIGMDIDSKPKLNKEQSFEFEQNGLRGEWQVIEKDGHSVEGVLFTSNNPNGELVLFIPGAPGDGVSWFEEKDMPLLLEKGYNVFSSRHGGVLPTEDNRPVFHNDQRFDQQTPLGDKEMTVNGWLKETEILLEHFSDQSVNIISHSLGGLSVSSSMVELQQKYGQTEKNPVNNVKRWVNLSGVNCSGQAFREKYQPLWQKYFDEVLAKKCNIKDIKAEMASLEKAIEKTSNELGPTEAAMQVSLVSVNPPEDELVGEDAGLNLQENVGRGLVIRDKTPTKSENNSIHDFAHLEPATLLRLLELETNDSMHIVTLGNTKSAGPFRRE